MRRDVENGNVAELGVDGWWPWCDVIRTNLVGFRVCHDEETRDWTLTWCVERRWNWMEAGAFVVFGEKPGA